MKQVVYQEESSVVSLLRVIIYIGNILFMFYILKLLIQTSDPQAVIIVFKTLRNRIYTAYIVVLVIIGLRLLSDKTNQQFSYCFEKGKSLEAKIAIELSIGIILTTFSYGASKMIYDILIFLRLI